MPINIEQLTNIYDLDTEHEIHRNWIMVSDSKEGKITPNVIGSSGGDTGNGWKIHISIDPEKIAQAAQIIAMHLKDENAPRVSIKFAGKNLAKEGQPSKQVAFIFYIDELAKIEKITAFLNTIESSLRDNNIGIDPRPINSDEEANKTKFDAVLYDNKGNPSRFNYRNEQCIIMVDEVFEDIVGRGDYNIQGQQFLIRQNYYLSLPDAQKHNPGNLKPDPFNSISITVALEVKEENAYNLHDEIQNNLNKGEMPESSHSIPITVESQVKEKNADLNDEDIKNNLNKVPIGIDNPEDEVGINSSADPTNHSFELNTRLAIFLAISTAVIALTGLLLAVMALVAFTAGVGPVALGAAALLTAGFATGAKLLAPAVFVAGTALVGLAVVGVVALVSSLGIFKGKGDSADGDARQINNSMGLFGTVP